MRLFSLHCDKLCLCKSFVYVLCSKYTSTDSTNTQVWIHFLHIDIFEKNYCMTLNTRYSSRTSDTKNIRCPKTHNNFCASSELFMNMKKFHSFRFKNILIIQVKFFFFLFCSVCSVPKWDLYVWPLNPLANKVYVAMKHFSRQTFFAIQK